MSNISVNDIRKVITEDQFISAVDELASENWIIKKLISNKELKQDVIEGYDKFPYHLKNQLDTLLLPKLKKFLRDNKINNILNASD